MGLAGLGGFDDGFVGGQPVPLGAGQVGIGGQFGLRCVVATHHLAALGCGFHHHLGAIDVHGEHVTTLVRQAVGGFGLLDGHGPVAGENHAAGDVGLDRAGAHQKRVDVAQHLRNGLGRHKSDLLAFGHVPGDHAVEVLTLVDVAKKAADVLGVFALGPHPAAMGKPHIRVLGGQREDVGVEVSERGGNDQPRAILGNHASHGLLHRGGFGHVLLFHQLDAGQLFQFGGSLCVGLVVAVVVARAHIDHPDRQGLLGLRPGAPGAQCACRTQSGQGFEGLATIGV